MCQNLCQGFRALRFSLTLAELHFDPKASDAREKLLKEAFVAKKLSTKQPTAPAETGEPAVDEVTVPLTVDTVDKSSPDFKSFQNSYNDYKRGANRYLNAYRSVSSCICALTGYLGIFSWVHYCFFVPNSHFGISMTRGWVRHSRMRSRLCMIRCLRARIQQRGTSVKRFTRASSGRQSRSWTAILVD